MEAPPDWDLLAVVRSCCTTTSATTSAVVSGQDLPPFPQQLPQEPCFSPSSVSSSSTNALFQFHNPFDSPTTSFITSPQDLQDICKPMICTTTSTTITTAIKNTACSSIAVNNSGFRQSVSSSPVSPSSSFRSFGVATEQQPQLRRLIKPTQVVFGAPNSTTTTPVTSSQGQRTKKRKNLMKKVCHVPAEGLSSDMWAWRKYGQKPIKGSPYPRGYYRCSSSKGCLARKQVERNRSDPKMFIVTYTAEHNHPMPTHRNSLAGSTRQKPLSGQQTTVSGDTTTTTTPPENPTCSSPSGNSLSPLTEKSESKTECEDTIKDENGEDNEMGISDLILNDDFYVGFEQIDGDDGSDSFSDHFSPSMEFPWLVNSSGTVTAAGGS